jgi:HTH-type transcriptional regulator/antitoxin HigA
MSTKIRHDAESVPSTYVELMKRFPLRPINDNVDLENAMALMDRLAVLDKPTQDQADYLHVLGTLIEEYEQNRESAIPQLSPMDALRFLMQEHGMSASDLGRLLGQRQLGSAILRDARKLSKTHILILAKHFRVRADLFLG